jgi:carbon storage regulator
MLGWLASNRFATALLLPTIQIWGESNQVFRNPDSRSVRRNTMLALWRAGGDPPYVHGQREGCPMLVLTRKPNQSIMIGDDIEVSVLSVVGEKVRIGIHAPHDIPVFRTEIYVEIQSDQGQQTDASSEAVRAEVDDALDKLGES